VADKGRKFTVQESSAKIGIYMFTAILVVVAIRPELGFAGAAMFLAAGAAMIFAKDAPHAYGNVGEHKAKADIAVAEAAKKAVPPI